MLEDGYSDIMDLEIKNGILVAEEIEFILVDKQLCFIKYDAKIYMDKIINSQLLTDIK